MCTFLPGTFVVFAVRLLASQHTHTSSTAFAELLVRPPIISVVVGRPDNPAKAICKQPGLCAARISSDLRLGLASMLKRLEDYRHTHRLTSIGAAVCPGTKTGMTFSCSASLFNIRYVLCSAIKTPTRNLEEPPSSLNNMDTSPTADMQQVLQAALA